MTRIARATTKPSCIKCVCSRSTRLRMERSFGLSPNGIAPVQRFSYRTNTKSPHRFSSLNERHGFYPRLCRAASCQPDVFSRCLALTVNCQGGATNQDFARPCHLRSPFREKQHDTIKKTNHQLVCSTKATRARSRRFLLGGIGRRSLEIL